MSDGKPKHTKEIALPLPPASEGGPPLLLRLRGDEVGPKEMSLGVVLPVRDGVPLPPGADLIEMRLSENGPHLEVKTIYESPDKPSRGGGWKPLSVSKAKFEENWDRIFRKEVPKDQLN